MSPVGVLFDIVGMLHGFAHTVRAAGHSCAESARVPSVESAFGVTLHVKLHTIVSCVFAIKPSPTASILTTREGGAQEMHEDRDDDSEGSCGRLVFW